MMQTNTPDALWQSWAVAERHADADALQSLLADDFRAVGPVGFVLDKPAWLRRYQDGLSHERFELDPPDTLVKDGTAIAVGVQSQSGSFQGHRTDGRFRVTLIGRREEEGWILQGLHLSPIRPPAA